MFRTPLFRSLVSSSPPTQSFTAHSRPIQANEEYSEMMYNSNIDVKVPFSREIQVAAAAYDAGYA
jgi:hypothetical protein